MMELLLILIYGEVGKKTVGIKKKDSVFVKCLWASFVQIALFIAY